MSEDPVISGRLGNPAFLENLSNATKDEDALEIERSALEPTVFPQDPDDEELFFDDEEEDHGFD